MDFLKLVRSLEELLYEVISWLFFYPRTLWRIIVHPLDMAAYTSREVKKEEAPFSDSVSPPLFLVLTLLLLHFLGIFAHAHTFVGKGSIGHLVSGNLQNLIIYRCIAFGLWSLIFALGTLRLQGVYVDRDSLRAPFFVQCFLVVPFAAGISISLLLLLQHVDALKAVGVILLCLSIFWYLLAQACYARFMLGWSYARAITFTALLFLGGGIINMLLGYVIVYE